MKKNTAKAIFYGSLSGTAFLIVMGVISAIFSTPFFKRMDPPMFLDYFFLIATSLLLGIFVALHFVPKNKREKCLAPAAGGVAGGFLGFSCALCNKLLIFLLGVSGVMIFIRPYQPLLGFIGVGLLLLAVVRKVKMIWPASLLFLLLLMMGIAAEKDRKDSCSYSIIKPIFRRYPVRCSIHQGNPSRYVRSYPA